MTSGAVPKGVNIATTTTRTDLSELGTRLERWLREVRGDRDVTVEDLDRSTASGMSSVCVTFSAVHGVGGARHDYVLRLAPEPAALPVFPDYDLRRQAAVGNAVGDAGRVPVPAVRWVEDSPEPLGRPFLVMDRAFGSAPPDNPPYVFGGALTDATPDQLARLQCESVEVLVGVHATPVPGCLAPPPDADGLGRFLDDTQAYYDWTIDSGGLRVPLIDEGLCRLRADRPRTSSPDVLTWGDARIGNILYRDFRPNAVLDWEGATLAPPELDVAWFAFFHAMYQDMAARFDKPGLPGFLRAGEVIAQYQRSSGRPLRDMEYYLMLAAVRTAVIFARIKGRSVFFGDSVAPTDPDEYVLHHRMLRTLLDDDYEWEI